jgi:hypothetical protein
MVIFHVQGVGLGHEPVTSAREWATFNYDRLKCAMLKHLPRLTDFGWMAMDHSDFAAEDLEPFGSFAAFPILETLDLDYDLFVHHYPGGNLGGDLPDC